MKVWHHPDADKLFCEEIDVGEESPRQIASGLRQHYSLEEMQDRKVLVVCNLKPAKIVGFESNGMVLAAKVCQDRHVSCLGMAFFVGCFDPLIQNKTKQNITHHSLR